MSLSVLGRAIEYDETALDELLSARHFVDVRKTLRRSCAVGDGARDRGLAAMLAEADTKWLAGRADKLQKADERAD